MKKLFILAFVLSGTFAFGANSNGCLLTEIEKVELNGEDHKTAIGRVHLEGTIEWENGCTATYDVILELGWFEFEIISGTVVMGEGCENPGTYTFGGEGTVDENGKITELDTFSEDVFVSSDEFSEALMEDINQQL